MIMSKKEIEKSCKWAANSHVPFCRDLQIEIMKSSKIRHISLKDRLNKILNSENSSNDLF